ncbi:hypothetical protein Bbelb_318970 [Branchiostoma belcheri]|nr:hypothetical protein Bbelb_318970 [Branchiostoma belcheri]
MAAANGHLHPSMNWDADDLVEEYKKFKQKTELAFKSFLKDTEPEQQVSYILLWVGSQGLDLFNSWEFTDAGDAKKPDKILEKFETHLEPKTNHRIYRYEFQGIQQKPDEPIDDYVARLKNVAKKCKFKDDAETKDRLVDQLIWGCIHKKVQKTLVGKPDLTLKDAMDTARAFEAAQKQMSSLSMQTGTSSSNRVDAVSKKTYQAGSKQKQPHMYKTYKQSTKSCRYCGNTHEFGDRAKCPAYGSNCNACGKPNHWGKMCRAKNRPQPTQNKPQQPRRYGKQKQRHVHLQREDQLSSESEGESLTIGTVYIHDMGNKEQKSQDEAYTSFQIRKKLGRKTTNIDLKLKIDTGAQSNVMPIQHYAKLCPEHMMKDGRVKSGILTPSDVILTAYGGARIPHLGKAQIEGKHKGRKVKCSFFITKAEGPIILGLKACQQLDIIRINHEVKTSQRIDSDVPIKDRPPIRNKEECIAMYPECFDNTVGCFDEEYHITVDPTVEPVVHPPRRVPLELREKLREQLNEMVEKGVISQVTQPTDWVNSIVVKEKPNGKLRVCLDPRDLNNALKRDHYPTPTLEEITPSLAGAKIFSKLDASNGYWNIKIDEESSLLTTFNTPFGRFKFNRLPFGLKVSQDVFQRKVDETYRGCKGAIGIADDIQVFGKTERDHDLHLHEAMEKTRQAGIKLNAAKCTIKESECTFFGMIYSADGVKPDPEKVEAITNMEEPRDKKELRSFLGLIQYMSSFIPRLADHTASIRELLKEDVEYDWCASHTRDFNKIKQLISEDITLQYYDREKPVTLQVDASMKGVGAALLQEGRPIAFASKALTPAESRYANIEREMLAVVYGCEKFKTYLYGRRFTIESDHKPLEQIDRKNLTKAPARLQRLLLRIQEYDYHLKYKPGNEMLVADALSRLSPSEKEEMAGLKVQIHHLVNVTTTKLEQIQEETSKDEELQTLAQTITRGWPEKRSEVQPLIREYWTIRDDISIENGVLLAGSRIIIPKSLQKEVLQTIHEGHMGEEKCKLRAKSAVYWIGMYKEIEKMVQTCRTCQKYQNSQQKEEMTPTETPSRPWKKVGADLFYLNQKWFLLVVDYYSKFPIVKTLKSLKASTVTQAFKGIFAEQGIPDKVICDNGTQFTSQEFRQAAEEYGFRITTSSPYYPKGHGFIERQVQTVKKTLTKSLETGEDPNLALLTLRTTPLRTDTKSPAELLNGRRYKTRLPTKVHPPADQEEVMGKLTAAQEKSKKQYDRQAQRLPELVRGQTVHIQEPIKKTWTPGQIVGKADTPKSYVVETESGKQMRRNRVHIRPTPEATTTINIDIEADPGQPDAAPRKGPDKIIKALDKHFKPLKNTVYERYNFNTCEQAQGESIEAYVERLRTLVPTCDCGALKDEMQRDLFSRTVSEPPWTGTTWWNPSQEYKRIKEEEPQLYKKFQQEARQAPKTTIEDLDERGRQQHAQKQYKSLAETNAKLTTPQENMLYPALSPIGDTLGYPKCASSGAATCADLYHGSSSPKCTSWINTPAYPRCAPNEAHPGYLGRAVLLATDRRDVKMLTSAHSARPVSTDKKRDPGELIYKPESFGTYSDTLPYSGRRILKRQPVNTPDPGQTATGEKGLSDGIHVSDGPEETATGEKCLSDGTHVSDGPEETATGEKGLSDGTRVSDGPEKTATGEKGLSDGTHVSGGPPETASGEKGLSDGTHMSDGPEETASGEKGLSDGTHMSDGPEETATGEKGLSDGTHVSGGPPETASGEKGLSDGTHMSDGPEETETGEKGLSDGTHVSGGPEQTATDCFLHTQRTTTQTGATERQETTTTWLKVDSPPHKALKAVVFEKALLRDMGQMMSYTMYDSETKERVEIWDRRLTLVKTVIEDEGDDGRDLVQANVWTGNEIKTTRTTVRDNLDERGNPRPGLRKKRDIIFSSLSHLEEICPTETQCPYCEDTSVINEDEDDYRGLKVLSDARHCWRKNAYNSDVVFLGHT